GTCENMNGLIRQYLPKGIDLNQADQHYLNQVAMSLNTGRVKLEVRHKPPN
ncbi:IS30 family transposase, partial [Acinetobacter baumannii]|nr:IS30 family transposase [Acinetobacter baumannii]